MTARLLIRGGTLVTPAGLVHADLECAPPSIAAIGPGHDGAPGSVVDAGGLLVAPGFVDIHVHGGGGHSFFTRDPAAIHAYSEWAPRHGVTSFLVSTVGRDAEETEIALAAMAPHLASAPGAEPLGFHLEGPFVNPARRGAFELATLRPPSRDEFAAWQGAARGQVRQVTIAPELPGALGVVRDVAASGAVAAMGHTDATSEEARAGFAAGIRHVTHLFNAMRPLHQREGGPIAAALLDAAVTCELICDGEHVAPDVLRLAYSVLGPDRMVVVTDNLAMAGTQAAGGRFGAEEITVSGAKAVKPDGTIAGSVAPMDQHFRNAMAFLGIDVATASRLCSANPARVVGARGRKGAIEPGYDADLVLLDRENRVVATICRGRLAYCAEPGRLSSAV